MIDNLNTIKFPSLINSINSGFPLIIAQDIEKLSLKNGEKIDVDFLSGEIKKLSTQESINAVPFSKVQLDIYHRGGLLR